MVRYYVLLAAFLAPAADLTAQPSKKDKFGWLSDYPAARAEAMKSGKPILLVFRCEP